MSTTIKPCPFCGSDDLEVCAPDDVFDHWYVSCNRCTSFGPPSQSEDDATKRWNQRPEEERLNAALTLEGELMAATHAHAGEAIAKVEANVALLQKADDKIGQLLGHLANVPIEHIATLTEPALRSQNNGIRYAASVVAAWLAQWKVYQ